MPIMRITLISIHDLKDVRSWSGVPYYMNEALNKEFLNLRQISCLFEKNSLFFKCKQLTYKYLLNKRYLRDREPQILKSYAHQVQNQLQALGADVILSHSTLPIAYLETSTPIVVWTDATFGGMLDFYLEFSTLAEETIRNGHLAEQQALDRCSLIVYTSEWAAQTAINFYNIDPAKVKVVSYGANIACDRTIDEVEVLIRKRPKTVCKLLFFGVDWNRKGGDVALEVAKALNARGVSAELTVIGCQAASSSPLPSFIKTLGFVNKSTQEGQDRINQALAESHFLILPTKADCTPIVFFEANSFGVPCLSSNVGGIPSVIRDDIDGKTFPINASIDKYCEYITEKFLDYQKYQELALSSFSDYETKLNWTVASKKIRELLEATLTK